MSALSELDDATLFDADNTPLLILHTNYRSESEQLSQELQALIDLEFDVTLTGFSLAEVDLTLSTNDDFAEPFELTIPAQIYAGTQKGPNWVSKGYLDDECDGLVHVTLDVEGRTLAVYARIGAGPPAVHAAWWPTWCGAVGARRRSRSPLGGRPS